MKIYRQGDVIIRETKKMKGSRLDNLVLAEGEVTGHLHRISEGAAVLYQYDDKKYLEIQSKLALLTHEEHKALELPAGKYEITIQRDYGPNGWRTVID